MAPYTADSIPSVKKGELIEFHYNGYNHFSVYTDVDDEANLNVERNIQSPVSVRKTIGVADVKFITFPFWSCEIVEKSIEDQCKRRGYRVNNLTAAAEAKGLHALKPDVIVQRAKEFLEDNIIRRYDLLLENCEHFATKCRYEKGFSQQVEDCCCGSGKWISELWSDICKRYFPMPQYNLNDRIIDAPDGTDSPQQQVPE